MKNVKRPLTKPAMMTKFLPKILLKNVELTRDKDSNDDKIPPKDLVGLWFMVYGLLLIDTF